MKLFDWKVAERRDIFEWVPWLVQDELFPGLALDNPEGVRYLDIPGSVSAQTEDGDHYDHASLQIQFTAF